MGPKSANIVEDLIIALRDQRVLEAISAAVIKPLLDSIAELKIENDQKSEQIAKLQTDLQAANVRIEALERNNNAVQSSRIEALEQYTRRDNLLITGLPVESAADAATSDDGQQNVTLEKSILKLFNDQLGVPVKPSDISIAHRLKKRNLQDPSPPITIVRFANRKTRDAVYSARRQLRHVVGSQPRIFINEDLNKATASIFRQARQLIRQRVIHSAWTSSCSVFIKVSADPQCRPQKIGTMDDLPRSPAATSR